MSTAPVQPSQLTKELLRHSRSLFEVVSVVLVALAWTSCVSETIDALFESDTARLAAHYVWTSFVCACSAAALTWLYDQRSKYFLLATSTLAGVLGFTFERLVALQRQVGFSSDAWEVLLLLCICGVLAVAYLLLADRWRKTPPRVGGEFASAIGDMEAQAFGFAISALLIQALLSGLYDMDAADDAVLVIDGSTIELSEDGVTGWGLLGLALCLAAVAPAVLLATNKAVTSHALLLLAEETASTTVGFSFALYTRYVVVANSDGGASKIGGCAVDAILTTLFAFAATILLQHSWCFHRDERPKWVLRAIELTVQALAVSAGMAWEAVVTTAIQNASDSEPRAGYRVLAAFVAAMLISWALLRLRARWYGYRQPKSFKLPKPAKEGGQGLEAVEADKAENGGDNDDDDDDDDEEEEEDEDEEDSRAFLDHMRGLFVWASVVLIALACTNFMTDLITTLGSDATWQITGSWLWVLLLWAGALLSAQRLCRQRSRYFLITTLTLGGVLGFAVRAALLMAGDQLSASDDSASVLSFLLASFVVCAAYLGAVAHWREASTSMDPIFARAATDMETSAVAYALAFVVNQAVLTLAYGVTGADEALEMLSGDAVSSGDLSGAGLLLQCACVTLLASIIITLSVRFKLGIVLRLVERTLGTAVGYSYALYARYLILDQEIASWQRVSGALINAVSVTLMAAGVTLWLQRYEGCGRLPKRANDLAIKAMAVTSGMGWQTVVTTSINSITSEDEADVLRLFTKLVVAVMLAVSLIRLRIRWYGLPQPPEFEALPEASEVPQMTQLKRSLL